MQLTLKAKLALYLAVVAFSLRSACAFQFPAKSVFGAGSGFPVPILSSIQPDKGPRLGGTVVTIFGARFYNSPKLRCRFKDGIEVDDVDGTYVSPVSVTCISPSRSNMTADLTSYSRSVAVLVANDGVTFSGAVYGVPGAADSLTVWSGTAVTFTYITESSPGASIVYYIEPSVGPSVGGTDITVYGDNFLQGSRLKCRFLEVNGNLLTSGALDESSLATDYIYATYVSTNKIMCRSPSTAGNASVMIVVNHDSFNASNDGTYVPYKNNFTFYDWVPRVTTLSVPGSISTLCPRNITYAAGFTACAEVDPALGDIWFAGRTPTTGNTEVTVYGDYFLPSYSLSCLFGRKRVPALWDSVFQIRCTTPAVEDPFAKLHLIDPATSAYNIDPDYGKDCSVRLNCKGTTVQVSNDGVAWSDVVMYGPGMNITSPNARILFMNLYVSPSGNDEVGDGTESKPFLTIQHAIDVANPDDRIILDAGRYTGLGNTGLRSAGKKIMVIGRFDFLQTVIDCEHNPVGFMMGAPYAVSSDDPFVGQIVYKQVSVLNCDAQRLWQ